MGFGRLTNQVHAGLFGRTAAFPMIAPEAGGNDVIPTLLATERNRHDVVERQILGRKFFAAVLTRVIIARIDVRTRKLHTIQVLDSDIFKQPDDRRQLDGKGDGMNLLVIFFNDFNFSGEE